MGQTVAEKIIAAHVVEGELKKGEEIGILFRTVLTAFFTMQVIDECLRSGCEQACYR
ncbi:MAG: hypothetical protein ACTFAL_08005 [Candidatus Electronema sp. V4]|uniref:hypothetical protein n=1 Tax=Candidatus Electronema sp. V4 TaxID=3454756 RepID=UPI0040554A44